ATAIKANADSNWLAEPNIGQITEYPPTASTAPNITVMVVDTYIFVRGDCFSLVGSSKYSWNINLASLVAVSRLVKAKADTDNAIKVFPTSKGIPNFSIKVPTPSANTLVGPMVLNLSKNSPLVKYAAAIKAITANTPSISIEP